MPLDRHWQRQQTPLRKLSPRERTILLVSLAVLAIAGVATALAAVGNGRVAPQQRGCVAVVNPSTMGAGMQRACGRAAQRFCATVPGTPRTAFDRQLQQACRRAGIAPAATACIAIDNGGMMMGGTDYRECGAAARQTCAQFAGGTDSFSREVLTRCREAGF